TYEFQWEGLEGRLAELCRREGVTEHMALMGTLQAVLGWWSGQQDVSVGTPVAGRTQEEVEGLIGFFVNTLVTRTDLSGDPSFRELLKRVRETSLEGYGHQDVPFEQVVERVNPVRDLGRTPLFQVMFQAQRGMGSGEGMDWSGVEVRPEAVGLEVAKFDLSVNVVTGGGAITGVVEYDAELYEERTVARLCRHYGQLLERALERPEARLSELLAASEDEHHEIEGWNLRAEFSVETTI